MTAAVTSVFVIIITCVRVIQVMQEQTRDCAWLVGRLNLFNAGSAVSEKVLAGTEIPGSGGRGSLGY